MPSAELSSPEGAIGAKKLPGFLALSAGFSLTRGYRNPAGLAPQRGEIQAVLPQERDEPSLVGEKPEPLPPGANFRVQDLVHYGIRGPIFLPAE